MQLRLLRFIPALLLPALAGCAGQGGADAAQACAADPAHWARSPAGGCLALQAYGPAKAETLVVVLHGDVSGGGAASYHRDLARRVAETLPGTATVALVRPGYPDGEGRTSDGNAYGRTDHYDRANIDLVAGAIDTLRARTGARRVIAIGHSGGAATAADILALHHGRIDRAVLLACPCDITAWRGARQAWTRSVSPISVADQVPRTAQVAAYTGTADTNTSVSLAQSYVATLQARGVQASFEPVPGATHNGIVDAIWTTGFPQVVRQFAAG